MKNWIFAVLIFSLSSCATAPFPGFKEYRADIDARSAGDKKFSGLYHNFEFRATLLTKSILSRINEREALVYGWSPETSAGELQKKLSEAENQTRVFVSFFTPRAQDDNLSQSSSIWKLYLHAGGKRYEGKAKKPSYNLKEAISMYPYHSRWATAYHFEFPMSTDVVENGPVKLEITGPLGQREVNFKE